jgi:hypothetical protein
MPRISQVGKQSKAKQAKRDLGLNAEDLPPRVQQNTRPEVTLIGPSYNQTCDQRKADCELVLGYAMAIHGYGLVSPFRPHNALIECARNLAMKLALASPATIALSMDSDNFLHPKTIDEVLLTIAWMHEHPSEPLLVGTYIGRNGMPMVWRDSEDPYLHTDDIPRGFSRCYFAGGGYMVLNLDWYREHWPKEPWWRTDWVLNDEGDYALIGEDAWHCIKLAEVSGKRPLLYPPERLMVEHAPALHCVQTKGGKHDRTPKRPKAKRQGVLPRKLGDVRRR